METVIVANVPFASSAAKVSRAFTFGQSLTVYNAITVKTVIVTERNFARISVESAKIMRVLKLLTRQKYLVPQFNR